MTCLSIYVITVKIFRMTCLYIYVTTVKIFRLVYKPATSVSRKLLRFWAFLNILSLFSRAVESATKVFKRDSASASLSRVFVRISPIMSKFSPKASPRKFFFLKEILLIIYT